jgi:hypothetical protein
VIRRCAAFVNAHIYEYAALSKTPHALADGLMLVFEHPANKRALPDGRALFRSIEKLN